MIDSGMDGAIMRRRAAMSKQNKSRGANVARASTGKISSGWLRRVRF
jgi:hypothetical protein